VRTRALSVVLALIATLFGPAPLLATGAAPTAPPSVMALCATDNDYVWVIISDQTGLDSYDVQYSTDFATWRIGDTLHPSTRVQGEVALEFTSKDAGTTFYARWASHPDLVGSNSKPATEVCPTGTIALSVTVQGGTATPGDFSPTVTGKQPNPPFGMRATVPLVPGSPVVVQAGWYVLTTRADSVPAGYHVQSATCGVESTTKVDQPSLQFEVDPTGPVKCEVVYGFGQMATTLTDSMSAGINKGAAGFTTAVLVVPKGTSVTFRVETAPNLAGRLLQIWAKTRTGTWKLTATRKVAADGTARYYARITAWTAFRAKWAGDPWYKASSSHSRVATTR
jgi:hypothetical protein